MPSRSIVSHAARAVGMTRMPPCDLRASRSSSTSVGVWIASISGTTRCGRSRSISARTRGAVEHVDHVAAMRDLHRRRIRVAIGGDHLHAEALQFDRHFLAQLAGAQQQHAGGVRSERGAKRRHRAGHPERSRILTAARRGRRVRLPPRAERVRSSGDGRARPPSPLRLCLALALAIVAAGCSAPPPPFAQLSGLILDTRLARPERTGRLARACRHAVGAGGRRQRAAAVRDLQRGARTGHVPRRRRRQHRLGRPGVVRPRTIAITC